MKNKFDMTTLSDKRWAAYAIAGTAAVMGAQQASALTVVDVNTNLEDSTIDGYFEVFGPYDFGAAGASFQFNQAFNETGTNVGVLTVIGNGNMSFAGGALGAYFYPSNMAYGANVAGAPSFDVTAGNRGDMAWGAGYSGSQFTTAGVGYIGFRFDLGAGTQYGWAELEMNGSPDNRAFFSSYGWGEVGEDVFVGARPAPVPLPGSLGLLALGSSTLLALRRKRAAAAAAA